MAIHITAHDLARELRGILLTLGLVALVTVGIFAFVWYFGLTRGTVVYLVPVLIAAIRWGLIAALFASICGVLASAFFFFRGFLDSV